MKTLAFYKDDNDGSCKRTTGYASHLMHVIWGHPILREGKAFYEAQNYEMVRLDFHHFKDDEGTHYFLYWQESKPPEDFAGLLALVDLIEWVRRNVL